MCIDKLVGNWNKEDFYILMGGKANCALDNSIDKGVIVGVVYITYVVVQVRLLYMLYLRIPIRLHEGYTVNGKGCVIGRKYVWKYNPSARKPTCIKIYNTSPESLPV